jgi:hypothetical protein
MADYERSTTAMTLGALPDPVREALLEHASASQLTLDQDAPAFVTRSRRLRKPGLFARLTGTADTDVEHVTALVLGARDVLVATHGERRGTAVLAARPEDVEVGSSADRLAAERGDDGVTVTGFPVAVEGTTGRGSFFVGLGAPDGDSAREALVAAVRRAKA